MKLSRYLLTGLALASLSTAAVGQVTVTPPNTVDAQGRSRATGTTFIVNADGSIATIGGATGTPGQPAPAGATVVAGSDGTNTRTIRTGSDGRIVLDSASRAGVTGDLAPGISDSGNPVKVGGYASAAAPSAVADGQRQNAWFGRNGQMIVGGQGTSGADGITQLSSVTEPGGGSRPLWTVGGFYNGTGYDRMYGANAASGTTGTGLLGVGNLGFDGNAWRAMLTDTNGVLNVRGQGSGLVVQGTAAAGAAASGNPNRIGGIANSAPPTARAAGQAVDAWYGLNGQAIVQLGDAAGVVGYSQANNDGEGTTSRVRARSVLDVLNTNGGFDRIRDANTANATTGTGLLGAGILGQYSATLPVYTNGQFGTLAMTSRGVLQVEQSSTATLSGDAQSSGFTGRGVQAVAAQNQAFNGSTYDRVRTVQGSDGTGLGLTGVAETPNSAAGAAIVPATALGATSLVGKASPGNLYGATVTAATTQTGAGYFIVANLAAAPASGTALTAAQVLYCVAVQPGATASMGGTGVPDRGTVGLTALYSTACNTFTPQATAPLHMRLRTQ